MKFVDGIKFGASFYLGWTLMRAGIDILSDPKAFYKDVERRVKMMEEEPKQKEKRIIGFHM